MTKTELTNFLKQFNELNQEPHDYEMEHTFIINGQQQKFRAELSAKTDRAAMKETGDFMTDFFTDNSLIFVCTEIIENNKSKFKTTNLFNYWRAV